MADKKIKGEQNRFIPGTNIERHREWRGLKDTWYDYTQWIKLLGIMMKFASISPARIVKGLFEYRWFGSFLAAFNMRDRCVEGLRGPALRVAAQLDQRHRRDQRQHDDQRNRYKRQPGATHAVSHQIDRQLVAGQVERNGAG